MRGFTIKAGLLGGVAAGLALVFACGSDGATQAGPANDASAGGDAGAITTSDGAMLDGTSPDAADPRCATLALPLATNPFAATQMTDLGGSLRNVRAFHGRVYVGYGDLNANTGPVEVTSFDPVAKTWTDHIQLSSESIERYVVIDDRLFAPCADGHGPEPTCQYGVGDPTHTWSSHDFTFSFHMMDATERVPGETLLTGSAWIDDAGTMPGAAVWRSLDGGPFAPIFPFVGSVETGGGPFGSAASLNGLTFAVTNSSVWVWNGTAWSHARTPSDPNTPVLLGEFTHPVVVAGQVVFSSFGNYLFSFDGKTTVALGIKTIDTPTMAPFTEAPIAIFDESEGRLLAVDDTNRVLMTTDLVHYTCIGRAPADVRGVGSMNGIVYFGGASGHFYAYAQPSW